MSQTDLPPADDTPRVAASPRARRLMRQLAIDAHSVRGSGPGGRIVEADLQSLQTGANGALAPQSVLSQPAAQRAALPQATGDPPSGTSAMRRAIARLTTASAAGVPHFYVRAEADAAALMACREALLQQVLDDVQVRLSLTDLLLRARALALSDLPEACATWQDDALVPAESVDLGLVVSVPGGLLVPILRQADRLSLAELACARRDLVAAAQAGRLGSDRLAGGVSSLSNLGDSRVDEFSALIVPPQSSILAVGRLAPRPLAIDGQLVVRPTLRLTLSADHRVLDGRLAAELLGRIVALIEQPTLLIYR